VKPAIIVPSVDCVHGTVVVPAPPVEKLQVPDVVVKPAPDTCTVIPKVPEFGVRAICGLTEKVRVVLPIPLKYVLESPPGLPAKAIV
jgi:hypothetical protein